MTKQNTTTIRTNPLFKDKLNTLRRGVSDKQDIEVSMSELTRRIANAASFNPLEKELLEDAKMKKRLNNE